MKQPPNTLRTAIDEEAITHRFRTALHHRTPAAVWATVADVPVLLAEVFRLASLTTWARTELANLLAAARATLAADRDGEPDPLWYLRDELAHHDELRRPEPDAEADSR